MLDTTLFPLCYAVAEALATDKHDSFTVAHVRKLAEKGTLMRAVETRLGAEPLADLTEDDRAHLAEAFTIHNSVLPPHARGFAFVMDRLLLEIHAQAYHVETAVVEQRLRSKAARRGYRVRKLRREPGAEPRFDLTKGKTSRALRDVTLEQIRTFLQPKDDNSFFDCLM
jgi:hypothetical protein